MLKHNMDKVMKDDNFNEKTPKFILNMALMAKNLQLNKRGFSPFQLVLGSVNTSNGLESDVAATEGFPTQIDGLKQKLR